jgi:hypothetical protein
MAKDLTPKEFKCSYGASCPGVFELEPEDLTPEAGDLLIVGKRADQLAADLGKGVGDDEYPIVIERGLLDEVLKCQADDSAKGERSSAPSSPLQSDVLPDAREPNSGAEWSLEQAAFQAANGTDVPEWAREIIKELWREVCARERWYATISQRQLDEGCKPDERTADSAEATKPCHRCGSGGLTYSSSGNGKPGRTIICRSCGWQASFDTPERGSTNQETNRIRKASGFAQWNRASAADMQPRSRILRGPIEEAQRADTATAASDAVSLTPNSTPQEAPAVPGDDNG